MAASVSRSELRRLVELRHHNPHSLLGAHATAKGWVIRAFKPGAATVTALCPDGTELPLRPMDVAGCFEGELEGGEYPRGYSLRVDYRGPDSSDLRADPYGFLPTLGETDLQLFGEGRHWRLWEKLGAHALVHQGTAGVAFSLWAPGAEGVSVAGDFNRWDGRLHAMRSLGLSGVWEVFIPSLAGAFLYKFEVRPKQGPHLLKGDPLAVAAEMPPGTASLHYESGFKFTDDAWMRDRAKGELLRAPLSIYEIHLGSWRRVPSEGNRPLTYRELAEQLPAYAKEMGFTHVELMPIMEHPFGGSWGYQVGNYYAPTARYGSPDDFRALVNALHEAGIGVILDWVPAHFPKDGYALGRFVGEALYEHEDPRQGEHPDWGTLIFNYGRNEVKNFLIANALYWLKEFHLDGLRIDAVASMLYLDYSRDKDGWIPNRHGGRENLEAIEFLKQLNAEAYAQVPGVLMIAEESTAWPGVSRPTWAGGLGFGFKWNMGWMHDTLRYFSKDPVHRRFHHDDLTFGLLYAWTENFILPLSHDEVVHGKGSLMGKMPGDRWRKFAEMRALFAYMWAHPGKKLLFMGGELGQWDEWRHDSSLDWHLLAGAEHAGLQQLVKDLNRLYAVEPALWDNDAEPEGFHWIDGGNANDNVVTFYRQARALVPGAARIVAIGNFSPVARQCFRVGLPAGGPWSTILNTDAAAYAGSGVGPEQKLSAQQHPWNGQPFSVELTLPPLGVLWLREGD